MSASPPSTAPARVPATASSPTLVRRLAAEALGTALLVTVVVGSGIMATRLTDDVAVQLLASSVATVLGLTALILMLGPVSGAHFNPAVSLAGWALARIGRGGRPVTSGLTGPEVVAYSVAQVLGAIAGAVLSNLMYDVPLGRLAHTDRTGVPLLIGEVVATAGLVLLIFSLVRSDRGALAAPAVGAYIGAAYWFTSSTSFANPAVTVGRIFSDTFAGIAPGSVPGFVAAQLVGMALAVALVHWLYPDLGRPGDHSLDDVVVPHPDRSTP